jgi:gamma-glutamylcyclotransferase (GGCT)/AIG2-like uncharacterized protein YtfP
MINRTNNPTIEPELTEMTVGDLFAVYGTLRRDQGNHRYLGVHEKAEYLDTITVPGILCALGGFPGLVQEMEGIELQEVEVEVYRLTHDDLSPRLDRLEGYRPADGEKNGFYIRSIISEYKGEPLNIYYYQGTVKETMIIPSGNWLNRGGY